MLRIALIDALCADVRILTLATYSLKELFVILIYRKEICELPTPSSTQDSKAEHLMANEPRRWLHLPRQIDMLGDLHNAQRDHCHA